jgi:glycogen(starch) synthase
MRERYGSPLVVFSGRLEAEKGVQTLIDAMPELRRAVPGVRLVVVGVGGAMADLTTRVRRRRLGDAVTFAGYVSESDLRAIVAAGDVAVVPSTYEPFGFVALEAMCLGTPLVAARTGGLAEIVQDGQTGWLVPAGDPAALAASLTQVLTDPSTARRRVAQARRDVADRFGWSSIAAQTRAAYERGMG